MAYEVMRDAVEDGKYIVFKREELFQMLGQFLPKGTAPRWRRDMIEAVEATKVPDAVVMRRQDRFAAGAFDAYADQITGTLDLFEDLLADVPIPPERWNPEAMRDTADYFRDQAHASRAATTKVPD